jgi:hypothetical protein
MAQVPFPVLMVVAAAFGGAGYVVATSPELIAAAHCDIKGNVSIETGERIYHVPGQRYYAATRISPEYGERIFCTEAEARAAGWRKSGV